MIDILDALNKNISEAKELLNTQPKKTVMFAKWNSEEKEYSNAGQCPYIRYCDKDGNINTNLVVGAMFNDAKNRIEILLAEDEYTETDGVWVDILDADDISYWSVLDAIEDFSE